MNFIKKLLKKKSVIAVIVIAAAVGGYYIYKNATKTPMTTRYVTAAATTGTVSVSVSGTGQVASTNQVDIKPQVSGQLLSLPIKVGQKVASAQVGAASPHGKARLSLLPRAAFSHSASLGKVTFPRSRASLSLAGKPDHERTC